MECPTTITMTFEPLDHIFFWGQDSAFIYATVYSVSCLEDRTLMLVIKTDRGHVMTLPACSVNKIPM